MSWCRSRVKLSSGLALFAMVLQIVLTFGHVHFTHSMQPAGHAGLYAGGESSNVANFSPHQAPGGTDEDCAICAIAHLATAAVLSAPSILPLPVHFGEAQYRGAGLAPSAEIPLRAFQARAPPLV